MNRIFFVNDARGIRKIFSLKTERPVQYLVLKEYLHSHESRALDLAGSVRIDAAPIFREVNEGFRDDFVSWMGGLNNLDGSPFWRQLNLAGKSALSTPLCERTFYAACLNRVIGTARGDVVIVYGDKKVIRQILSNWTSRRIHDFTAPLSPLRAVMTELLPGKLIHRLGLTLWRKTVSGPTRILNSGRMVVLKTVISPAAFGPDGAYRDIYYGELLDFLRKNKRNFVVIGIVLSAYRKFADHSKRRKDSEIFSLEQSLGWADLFACFARAFWMFYARWFRPCAAPPFRKTPMSQIVTDSMREELTSGQYVLNLMNARSTEKILRNCDVERMIIPYENRGWERADMMAVRASGKDVPVIGYQHAAITPKHTEYFRTEGDTLPLPDTIITMGKETSRILAQQGNYPSALLRTGCALRQAGTGIRFPARRPQVRNLLIILSTSPDYYRRTIAALNCILPPAGGLSIKVRAHPLIPLTPPLKSSITFAYEDAGLMSQDDAIDWADAALYSSSTTLAFNCLQRGKPVFYVPVDDYLDADPLFELTEGKWVVRTAKDLKQALAEVESMRDKAWRERLARAQEYVMSYFGAVSESAMRQFLE